MIPVYNSIAYLRETIESVLSQDLGESLMEIEVVDDNSTDGNVRELVYQVSKGRVKYYKQHENVGSLRNFETCINRSSGHYIHLLHADDRVENGFYKEIDELFNLYPQVGAAFTNFLYIDHQSKDLTISAPNLFNESGVLPDFLRIIAKHQLIQPPAMVVKRSTYERLGGFYGVHYGEDWEMWTRIAANFPIAYSPKTLAKYRVGHGQGISHHSFLEGRNVSDIMKVIDNIQIHLPNELKAQTKRQSLAYHAKFNIKLAGSFLSNNKAAAFRQIKGAWQMDKSINTIAWIIRFYLMYLLRYKSIHKRIYQVKSTISLKT
ncbi:glycosyltransferase [Algoriphagus chordae]|nr:glycosyltransferase [Algoriphagus chordae]